MAEIIINANDRRIQYTASGAQIVFPYDFPIYANTEVTVLRNRAGVLSTLVLTTDYAVSGVGVEAGGNITLTSGATAGDIMTIFGSTPYERTTDYGTGGDFKASNANKDFDRLAMMAQQLNTLFERALRLSIADPAAQMELAIEAAAARIDRALVFNSAGTGLEAGPSIAEIEAAGDEAAAAAASAVTAAAAAALLKGTSTTSLAIATGSKAFTTQAGKQFNVGQYVLVVSDANPTVDSMYGKITAYSGTSLTVSVSAAGGSGTHADWSIYVAGAPGAVGAAGSLPIAAAGGTADAITANFTPDLTLSDQVVCLVVAGAANTSATPTFAPDGLTECTIVTKGGASLVAGDISAAGHVLMLEYNLANTRWELLNPAKVVTADIVNNSVTLAKLATQAANTILAEITGSTAVPTAVALAANRFLARSSAGNIAAKTITDFALTLLDDADAATMRATLGIGSPLAYHTYAQFSVSGTTPTINKQVNCSGVVRDAGGRYTITYTSALPSNPLIFLTAFGNSGNRCIGGYLHDAGAKTITFDLFQYNSGTLNDPLTVSMMVFDL